MSLPYRIIVGMEIHVELETATKMFCRCVNDPFHAEKPNQHVCPVCLGLPGALPVPNQEAIRKAITVGKALGATIATLSKWDRKHYFYPDLPKGYQISQYDMPLCEGGQLELLDKDGEVESVIRFERAHLEEDAGKLMHGAKKGYSRVDLNRAGVPLLEMVSRPDITSAAQARRLLQELQLLVRTIGVSHADMEKGQMRCDVNINIAFEHDGKEVRTPITEVKNVNSSRAVERAITTETQRQYDEWLADGPIRQRKGKITAGWDENSDSVTVQRAKEGLADYRYMPEPDIPPVAVYELDALHPEHIELPELPNSIRRTYLSKGLVPADIELLLEDGQRLLTAVKRLEAGGMSAKDAAKWLIQVPGSEQLSATHLSEIHAMTTDGSVSFSALKPQMSELAAYLANGGEPRSFMEKNDLLQAHDESVVQSAVTEVIAANPQAVADFESGNERILGFFVGQVMKKCAGKAQPAKVQEAVRTALTIHKK
jgi:aspartyl-tRNA(Asn)/glutamyl-tRNA(Gln) amidotransferase subunit B